jgi:hypothetical protein
VTDEERMAVLARRLAPVAITLFLAQAFFLVGFFFDKFLGVSLVLVTMAALVGLTVRDYRADMEQRRLVEALRGQEQETVERAHRREVQLLDDITRVTDVAVAAATPPALLNAQLSLLGPLLVDLLATPSAARRESLLDEIGQAAVQACAELVGGRAVFYRRVGPRFEPAWTYGRWWEPPARAGRTSPLAGELRDVLRRRLPVQALSQGRQEASAARVRVPVQAGRRGVGVLCAERSGDERVSRQELDALAVVCALVACAAAGLHACRVAKASERTRARWAGHRRELGAPVRVARVTRAATASALESMLAGAAQSGGRGSHPAGRFGRSWPSR